MTECLLLFGSRIHEPGKKLCLISAVSRYVTFIKCTLLDNIQSTWSMPGRALLNSVLVSMCSGTSLHPTAGISAQRCRIFRDRCSQDSTGSSERCARSIFINVTHTHTPSVCIVACQLTANAQKRNSEPTLKRPPLLMKIILIGLRHRCS